MSKDHTEVPYVPVSSTGPAAPSLVERLEDSTASTKPDILAHRCHEAAQALRDLELQVGERLEYPDLRKKLRESEEENKRWLAKAMLYAPRLEAAEAALAKHKELLEEIAVECEERGEADLRDGRYIPDAWMALGTRIREFLR